MQYPLKGYTSLFGRPFNLLFVNIGLCLAPCWMLYINKSLNKLSIEKHVNGVFPDFNSTPYVTIFWKIFDKNYSDKNKTLIYAWFGGVDHCYFLRYRPVNSAHYLLSPACSPLHHRPGWNSCANALHRFEFKICIFIWITTKLFTYSQRRVTWIVQSFVFLRDCQALHQSWKNLVLWGLIIPLRFINPFCFSNFL